MARTRILTIAIGALALAGCGHAPVQINDRQDYLAEATRMYPGEQKERVIQAAETILKSSDPGKLDMRYTGKGFVGLRQYAYYAILVAGNGQEKWEFEVEERTGAQFASLSVSDAGIVAAGSSVSRYESSLKAIPLYRLFWKRMDYMLGRRADWVACADEAQELEKSGVNPLGALSGLCGGTSAGRNDAPPPPLGRNSVRPANRTS